MIADSDDLQIANRSHEDCPARDETPRTGPDPSADVLLSHAQNFEDVMLWRALGHVQDGFFVDVGAHDPLVDSVSKAFSLKGWGGINVEPSPFYAERLRQDRPREKTIQAAVSTRSEDMAFYYFPEAGGISTGDPDIARSHEARGYVCTEITVPSISLAEVLEQSDAHPVHWLKIDVECMEKEVLKSWGVHHCRPWIVVIESIIPFTQIETHTEWESYLTDRGYEYIYFDGINRFYIHTCKNELRNFFNHGPCVLDNFMLSGHNKGFVTWIKQKYTERISRLQNVVRSMQQYCPMHKTASGNIRALANCEKLEYSRSNAMSDHGYTPISRCRISGSDHLISVLNLGFQDLTGVFPRNKDAAVTRGPLELLWCPDSGLLQLGHSYNLAEMYGENYGYRSGLNQSMVRHLTQKIHQLESRANLNSGDVVLDIGSNDSTSLQAYRVPDLTRIGIDPAGMKFKQYYPDLPPRVVPLNVLVLADSSCPVVAPRWKILPFGARWRPVPADVGLTSCEA